MALTKSAAQEYATRGVRVNALVAGAFRTPMLERVFGFAGGGTPDGRAGVEAQYSALKPDAPDRPAGGGCGRGRMAVLGLRFLRNRALDDCGRWIVGVRALTV